MCVCVCVSIVSLWLFALGEMRIQCLLSKDYFVEYPRKDGLSASMIDQRHDFRHVRMTSQECYDLSRAIHEGDNAHEVPKRMTILPIIEEENFDWVVRRFKKCCPDLLCGMPSSGGSLQCETKRNSRTPRTDRRVSLH